MTAELAALSTALDQRRSTEHRTRRLVHQLEQLSHTVTLEPNT